MHDERTSSKRITRRALIASGAATAAATYVELHAPAKALALGLLPSGPAHLRRSAYMPLVGRPFTVSSPTRTLELTQISDLEGEGVAGAEDAFMLTFAGAPGRLLPPGVHRFRQRRLGAFELFVSPVGQPQSLQEYSIVIDTRMAVSQLKAIPTRPAVKAPGSRPGAALAQPSQPAPSGSIARRVGDGDARDLRAAPR